MLKLTLSWQLLEQICSMLILTNNFGLSVFPVLLIHKSLSATQLSPLLISIRTIFLVWKFWERMQRHVLNITNDWKLSGLLPEHQVSFSKFTIESCLNLPGENEFQQFWVPRTISVILAHVTSFHQSFRYAFIPFDLQKLSPSPQLCSIFFLYIRSFLCTGAANRCS